MGILSLNECWKMSEVLSHRLIFDPTYPTDGVLLYFSLSAQGILLCSSNEDALKQF
jgi:hypothetical protein